MELLVSAAEIYHTKDPGKYGLGPQISISSCFMRKSFFYPLDNFYQQFTYAYGQVSTGKKHTLEITDKSVGKWENDEIMKCFVSLQLFARWYRQIMNLYFDNKVNLGK
ncbi:8602_t:CDS:2, partial [Diversispora eburnea]